MSRLNLTDDQIRSQLFSISSLQEKERHVVAELIDRLSDNWFPDALRRELRKLQNDGSISETDRHAVEHAFFPDHAW